MIDKCDTWKWEVLLDMAVRGDWPLSMTLPWKVTVRRVSEGRAVNIPYDHEDRNGFGASYGGSTPKAAGRPSLYKLTAPSVVCSYAVDVDDHDPHVNLLLLICASEEHIAHAKIVANQYNRRRIQNLRADGINPKRRGSVVVNWY